MRARFEPVTDGRPVDNPWGTMQWPPGPDIVLTNSTVTLRSTDGDADADGLFTALDDDRVWTHVAGRPESPAAWTASMEMRRAAGVHPWTVTLTSAQDAQEGTLPAGTIVGLTSYLEVSVADARLEVGWTSYSPAVWGSRVNPAAKLLLLEHAFETLGAGRVQIKTDVRNHRSQQAIHRLGATYEGTLRRYQRRADGTVRDTVMFSITAEEWPTVKAGLQERLSA